MITINDFIEANIDVGFCINLDTDDLSVAGQREVVNYLCSCDLPAPDYTFDWRIKTDRGSLPKRLASYVYNKYDEKMDNSIKENIGYICDKYRAYKSVFFFKFDSGLFWNLGEFSDHDSCYWQSKSSMRSALNGSGRAYAIKIYEDEQMKKPWGRAIIITRVPNDDSLLCINAYPKGFQVTNIGRLLVKLAKLNEISVSTKLIHAVYEGSWKDYLWINGGNCSIVAPNVGEEDTIDIKKYLNLYNCAICKKRSSRMSLPNNIGLACKTCYQKFVKNCKICGSHFFSENNEIRTGFGTIALCNNCITKAYKCDSCGDLGFFDPHRMISFLDSSPSQYRLYLVPSIGVLCPKCFLSITHKTSKFYNEKSMRAAAKKLGAYQYITPVNTTNDGYRHLKSAMDLAIRIVSNYGKIL